MKPLYLLALIMLLSASCKNGGNQTIKEQKQPENRVLSNVSAQQFFKLKKSDSVYVLDVRTPEEWAEGIIPSAHKLDFYDDEFSKELDKIDKNLTILVYCRSGGRSGKAMKIMDEKGFVSVYNLEGGITAWKEQGYKTVGE